MDQGTEFSVVARTFYPRGELIETLNLAEAVKQTKAILRRFNNGETRFPIYEAGFVHDDVAVRVDILVPGFENQTGYKHSTFNACNVLSVKIMDFDGVS